MLDIQINVVYPTPLDGFKDINLANPTLAIHLANSPHYSWYGGVLTLFIYWGQVGYWSPL